MQLLLVAKFIETFVQRERLLHVSTVYLCCSGNFMLSISLFNDLESFIIWLFWYRILYAYLKKNLYIFFIILAGRRCVLVFR